MNYEILEVRLSFIDNKPYKITVAIASSPGRYKAYFQSITALKGVSTDTIIETAMYGSKLTKTNAEYTFGIFLQGRTYEE